MSWTTKKITVMYLVHFLYCESMWCIWKEIGKIWSIINVAGKKINRNCTFCALTVKISSNQNFHLKIGNTDSKNLH